LNQPKGLNWAGLPIAAATVSSLSELIGKAMPSNLRSPLPGTAAGPLAVTEKSCGGVCPSVCANPGPVAAKMNKATLSGPINRIAITA